MTGWLAQNFPVSTFPVFLSTTIVLLCANVFLWRKVFLIKRKGDR